MLQLQGALFDIADGVLRVLDKDSGRFEPVVFDLEPEPQA